MKIHKVESSHFKNSVFPAIFCEPRPDSAQQLHPIFKFWQVWWPYASNQGTVPRSPNSQRPREGSEDSNRRLFAKRFFAESFKNLFENYECDISLLKWSKEPSKIFCGKPKFENLFENYEYAFSLNKVFQTEPSFKIRYVYYNCNLTLLSAFYLSLRQNINKISYEIRVVSSQA